MKNVDRSGTLPAPPYIHKNTATIGAVAAAAALMLWQHRLVRADDLSRVDAAFFSANGLLAVVMGGAFVVAKIIG